MLSLIVLGGCKDNCDPPPVDDINALYLKFKTDGDNGFSEEERNSMYLVRYFDVPGDSLTFPSDTMRFFGNLYQGSNHKLRISNDIPFKNDSLFFVAYNYGFYFESDSTLKLSLTDISLRGKYVGDCAYENKEKTFKLNGQFVNRTANQDFYEISK